jgi:peptidyl-prolyl cis-trans isomerase SurA
MKNGVAIALGLAALANTVALPAQTIDPGDPEAAPAAPSDAQGTIVIPDNITMFGKNDPNLRRATAVVNGDIITGTDVDQRLALILAANEGKVSQGKGTVCACRCCAT